jgi:hypothetical protein
VTRVIGKKVQTEVALVEVIDLGVSETPKPLTLAQAGIDKNLAKRAQA